jgi:cytochrome c peroxidase
MKGRRFAFLLVVAATVVVYIACGQRAAQTATIDAVKLELFQPLPTAMTSSANPLTDEKIALGRMLYYEIRLSKTSSSPAIPATA